MDFKFIGCFIAIHPSGEHAKGPEMHFQTFEVAQSTGEELLPSVTAKMAPDKVIWMVREIAA